MVFERIIVGLHHKKYPETIISFQFQDTNFFYLLPSIDKTCLVSERMSEKSEIIPKKP